MKTKALFIDAKSQTISEVKIGRGLQDVYTMIGGECQLVETAFYGKDGDWCVVDEEGLFHSHETGFAVMGDDGEMLNVFVGSGVMMGADEEGDTVDVKTTVEELSKRIQWVDKSMVNRIKEMTY